MRTAAISSTLRAVLTIGVAGALSLSPSTSIARESVTSSSKDQTAAKAVFTSPKSLVTESDSQRPRGKEAFCAPEFESLTANQVCYLDGGKHDGDPNKKRTLVIFLHGAIAKNTTWSWNHQRMMIKLAKATNVEMIFPRSPSTEAGFVWPGSIQSQEANEQSLIDQWTEAKRLLEARDGGRAFDEVFVMGFSSGAYFTSSLAMRGRLDFADGYAVFAGGQPMAPPTTPAVRRSPVFVGVCADDDTTATHSRAFAGSLTAAGIPRSVMEQHVGHGLSHVHFTGALGYLRNANKQKLATR